jgi:demethylmenaquinone methyltransferase/2-methoxy-6-polyprenyl-1,4-benzoquinol methylase
MPLIDHFGFIAPFYDRVFKPGERNELLELAGLPVDGNVLDAGGGTGRIAQLLRGKAADVVVADLSFEMLLRAKEKGGLLTTCSHTEQLPFDTHSFDRILMIDALHHVCDHLETARELWRLVKPGGRIVIEEPDIRTWGVKMLALAEKILGMRSHFLAPPAIAALFGDAANIDVVREGIISWVIVEKPNNPEINP